MPKVITSIEPAGKVITWAGNSATPDGYLECNGQPISKTTYPLLFAAVGVVHGDGSKNADGTSSGYVGTHFNLPDYRGRFLRHVDGTASRDPDSAARTAANIGGLTGNVVGSVQTHKFQDHSHTVYASGNDPAHNWDNGSNFSGNRFGIMQTITSSGASNTPSTETRPVNANVKFLIKF